MALVDLRTKNKKKGTTKWEGKNSTWVSGRTNKIIAPRSGTKQKVGAVSKQVYVTLLKGDNIDELYENEEDKQKAIEGFTTYLATEKLGDEVLKVLDSPMGSADKHEGVVIRDKNIADVPFKITGKFILGGMQTGFR